MLPNEPNEPINPPPPPAKPPDDELTKQLRDAAHRKRPRGHAPWLLTLFFVASPLAFLVWWFWPKPQPPELHVIGFDQVAAVGKSVLVRAATEPLDADNARWGGRNLFFVEIKALGEKQDRPLLVRTDTQGIAETRWTPAAQSGLATIEVTYLDETSFRRWFDRTQLRIFTWPRESRLLVIDIEPTLQKADDWPELVKALKDTDAAGWRTAYLAAHADTPTAYRKARDWALEHMMDDPTLVVGPVLARLTLFNEQTPATARQGVLAKLKAEFTGPVIFVESNKAGLQFQAVGPGGEFVGEAVLFKKWAELADALPK